MDAGILYGIQDFLGNPAFDAFFPYFTMIGEAGAIWILVALCMLFSREWRFWGLCLLAGLTMVLLLNELGLKHMFERIRPYIALGWNSIMLDNPTSFSFPSGHSACSLVAATVITLSPAKGRWKVVVWIVAILICFSRLYLFAHYPSDVLVGAALGAVYGLIVVKVGLYIKKRREDEQAGKHAAA